jgi:hypothetical protein
MKSFIWIFIGSVTLFCANSYAELSVNVPKIPIGQLIRTELNGTNICMYRRTAEDIVHLKKMHGDVEGSLRSQNVEFFIFDCVTPQGCFISFKPKGKAGEEFPNVRSHGGFLDTCFNLEYDFSGRQFDSINGSQSNLKIPVHHYEKDGKVTFP